MKILVLSVLILSAPSPQTDPCFCEDAGGVWYALPDIAGGPSPGNPMDGVVDVQDLLRIIRHWGECRAGDCCVGDIDRDGEIGVRDLLLVIQSWGTYPGDFVRCREIHWAQEPDHD